MKTAHATHTVLVPIFGGDISDRVFAAASSLLEQPESRLVLLHVVPADKPARDSSSLGASAAAEPRWHRLASAVPPDCTFIDAVAGDSAEDIRDEAERFHSDLIVL